MDLTPEQQAELDELVKISEEAAEVLRSPWEPRCVARAFASHQPGTFTMTMQVWIDLAAIRSPLLQEAAPESLEEFRDALEAFGVVEKEGCELTPEEAAVMTDEMLTAVRDAFSMGLKMQPPNGTVADEEPDGFGDWLIVWAALKTQCGCTRAEALAFPVGQAFALIAAARRNEGWKVTGEPYALRDMKEDASDA
jgi:hypothetical protein